MAQTDMELQAFGKTNVTSKGELCTDLDNGMRASLTLAERS